MLAKPNIAKLHEICKFGLPWAVSYPSSMLIHSSSWKYYGTACIVMKVFRIRIHFMRIRIWCLKYLRLRIQILGLLFSYVILKVDVIAWSSQNWTLYQDSNADPEPWTPKMRIRTCKPCYMNVNPGCIHDGNGFPVLKSVRVCLVLLM